MIQVTLAISEFMMMLIWAGLKVFGWFGGIALAVGGGAAITGLAGRRLLRRRAGK